MKIQFLGAAETVTGSRYLLTHGKTKILIDCGLFQGFKNLRLKNWNAFPIPPSEIDAVLLTHAHLDHSGYLPLLIKNGFRGKVFCTSATADLCALLLPDSGHLQEEEARFANKHGFSKHAPALPLYTEKDAELALKSFSAVNWKQSYSVSDSDHTDKMEFSFFPAGHLFGAASILVRAGDLSVAFSGDLGRIKDPIVRSPDFDLGADFLIVESTYGNRNHVDGDPQKELGDVILRTFQRKGTLIIPSFAVGSAQLILHYIHQLKVAGTIPDIPVYLNSPMALKSNDVFCRHSEESKMSFEQAKTICSTAKAVRSVEESIALNERKDSMIIVAASGMATGGRVLHHLRAFVPNAKNTILFVGFQAGGTRGDGMTRGARDIKIHGKYWPVQAEVAQLDSMSGHADGDEILKWIENLKIQPRRVFVTHGEPAAADEMRRRIADQLKIDSVVPQYAQIFDFDPKSFE